MKRTFIIAEAGVNHNGRIDLAKRLIDVAKAAGVDAVKFQTFNPELLVSRYAPKAEYQQKTTSKKESHLQLLKKLQLDEKSHRNLISYCRKKKIQFLSSPFDSESIDLLDRLGLAIFKIPSGEITNIPYLRKIGALKKKIILSSGMSTMEEIRKAINVLIGSGTLRNKITVLHCNTEYPTPMEDVNLKAMAEIKETCGVDIGYSDHTLGIEVPVAAVVLGASVIEKHLTLDRTMKGPDHKGSLEPQEFKNMVTAIRNIEKALGSGIKQPSPSELKNKAVARKSLVALKDILKGELFTQENVTVKRPGTGISPVDWDKVMGRCAKRNFKVDEVLEL